MNILSIQSHVVYGHVGNSAAVFPLQRIGVEVWAVPTVLYSNHTGYGQSRGQEMNAAMIRDLVEGIDARGLLGECDGVLSGYLGTVEVAEAIVETVGRVKSANPSARYCCDPVIGDRRRGVFVAAGLPEFIKERALSAADVITPNQFELDYLVGGRTATLSDVLAAVAELHAAGPRVILVTSLRLDDTPEDSYDLIASDETGRYRLRIPRLPILANGAGDATAALFFAHHLRTGSAANAMALAISSVFSVLSRTAEEGSHEMLLVAAQDEFVKPSRVFKAKPI